MLSAGMFTATEPQRQEWPPPGCSSSCVNATLSLLPVENMGFFFFFQALESDYVGFTV